MTVLGLTAVIITVALTLKTFPLFFTKVLYFCQKFIPNFLHQIPLLLPGMTTLVLLIILLIGITSLVMQLVKTQFLLNRLMLMRIDLTDRIRQIISSLDLEKKVHLIEDNNLFSLCIGFFSPKIIISTSLVTILTDRELEAVLLHERTHLKNRDPFKILIGKTISSAFFFLPIFSELYQNMEAANELIADYWTTEIQKDTKFLCSALRKIIAQPQISFTTVPAISHPDHIAIRVYQLKNIEIKHKLTLSYSSIIGNVIFIFVSLFVLQTPVDAFHMEKSSEPSYFVCSVDNACRQKCHHNANISVSDPNNLFTPVKFSSASKYEAPSYK